MGLKSSHWSCLKACFKGYTFCFTTFWSEHLQEAQQSHERVPKNVQMTLKDQSFVNKCVPPWRRVTFKFWEMLKNASEVTLVPKNIFFLKIVNIVESFVECKVSLADGIYVTTCSLWLLKRESRDGKGRSFVWAHPSEVWPKRLS